MGVKTCSRAGCGDIMCDTAIPDIGYICYSCQDEFKAYIASKPVYSEMKMLKRLKKFMDSESKLKSGQEPFDVDAYFRKH